MSDLQTDYLSVFNFRPLTEEEQVKCVTFTAFNYLHFKRCLASAIIEKSRLSVESDTLESFAIAEAKILVFQELVLQCEAQHST